VDFTLIAIVGIASLVAAARFSERIGLPRRCCSSSSGRS
jgi:hypothetical protein